MNLFNREATVKQLMPPKWRKVSWKMAIAMTVTKPFDKVYRSIIEFKEFVLYNMNITPQVMVIENYLQRNIKVNTRDLFIIDSGIHGKFIIMLKSAYSGKISDIHELMRGRLVAGTSYTITTF